MDRASLDELRESWRRAVLLGDRADWPEERRRLLPCWFGLCVPGIDSCEGRTEGAHWIKRQRVESHVGFLVDVPILMLTDPERHERACGLDLVNLAAWDPRNGVPACEKHHRRFDGHRVDARNELVIWRHEVPGPVEAFALDWGLETALNDRNPPIQKEI